MDNVDKYKKIQKFFTVQLSQLSCLMSPCCGLEFFKIKVALCVSVEEETQRPHYNYHPAVCCCPHASQKQGEHLNIAWTALYTVAWNSYNFIFIFGNMHTVSDLDRETGIMHARLVSALFLNGIMFFLFRLIYLGGIYLGSGGFMLLWVNAMYLKWEFEFV